MLKASKDIESLPSPPPDVGGNPQAARIRLA